MENALNKEFHDEIVVMDGVIFIDCTFANCVLVYSGGEHNWINCKMSQCRVVVQGPAARTQQFLSLIGWKPPNESEIPSGSAPAGNFGPN